MKRLARALVALALAALVPWLQARLDARLGTFRSQEDVLYVWSGERVRRLAPGLDNVMADLYWIRTIQYFGGTRAFSKERRFELLEPLIDITVTLDPRFDVAYRYGATFLSEAPPFGAGRPEAGIRLLERGARHLPNAWILQQNLGFFTYLYLRDGERAAAALLRARQVPGAPVWLETLAADLLGKGGRRDQARQMWQRLYEQSEGPMRENARYRLDLMAAEDLLEGWDQRVQRFHESLGRWPRRLDEAAGDLPSLDPTGVPLAYDAGSGRAGVARKSSIWHPSVDLEQRAGAASVATPLTPTVPSPR